MDQEFGSLAALRMPGESRCTDFVTLRARVQAHEADVSELLHSQKDQACVYDGQLWVSGVGVRVYMMWLSRF